VARPKRQFANQDVADAVDVRAKVVVVDVSPEDMKLCADWKLQIKLAEKRNATWEKRCERIIKRYREERPSQEIEGNSGSKRMNILWSNVETLQPSVYGREPVPIVERRFLDRDDTGRIASQILERSLRYEMPFCGFHDTTQQAVLDYLLVGRGQAWIRYKPIIGPATSLEDMGDDDIEDLGGDGLEHAPDAELDEAEESDATTEQIDEQVLSASLEVEYIHWKDFLHSKARFWKENTWVARRLYPSRKDLIDDFGKEIGGAIPLEMSPETTKGQSSRVNNEDAPESARKGVIYEIWDKATRKVYFVADGFDQFLKEPVDDPLNLEGFWPCPKPLFATMTNDTLEPVPDYIEYQDQALEIDELTNRIDLLISALRVSGVYDSSVKELARLLDEGAENRLIPVPNYAAFAAKGGLEKAVSFMPIEEIANVLKGLFDARDKIKADLFEITGMSDIVRGQADPRETAEAVKTKGRWGSLRLQARQANVARFCRDIIAMMGEVISEHFPTETLINTSGVMYDEGIAGEAPMPPDPPQTPPAPMMGHNGGPPMLGPSQSTAGLLGPTPPPSPGTPPPVMAGPPAPGMVHPPMPGPGAGPMVPGRPMMPPPGGMPPQGPPGAPPQMNPQFQYVLAMAKYNADMQAYEAKKMAAIEKAIDLLRQDKLRGFRIDIETDSTINADANDERESSIAFIQGVTKYMETAFQIAQQQPEAVQVLGKMLLFSVRRFRTGRDLESTLETFIEKMEKQAKAKENAPPQPSPEQQKAMIDLQAAKQKSQAEVQKAQIDAQSSAEDNQREMASKQMDAQIAQQQAALDMEKMRQQMEMQQAEFAMKMRQMQMEMELSAKEHDQKLELAHTSHRLALEKVEKSAKEAA
jgi:hypothetical protein